jgi:hypothetical protein
MKKSKTIFLIIFLIAVAAILYFSYGVVKSRYFSAGKNNIGTENGATQNQVDNQSADNQENASSDINSSAPGDGRPNIQSADCDNDCANFKDNQDNLKYCQEVCGIRPVTQKDSETQCDSLAGLEKDSCWRDLAVSKKDFSFCDKISDAKLQKVCENRVTEELLN